MHRASVIGIKGFFRKHAQFFVLKWYGEFLKLFQWYIHRRVWETLKYQIILEWLKRK